MTKQQLDFQVLSTMSHLLSHDQDQDPIPPTQKAVCPHHMLKCSFNIIVFFVEQIKKILIIKFENSLFTYSLMWTIQVP